MLTACHICPSNQVVLPIIKKTTRKHVNIILSQKTTKLTAVDKKFVVFIFKTKFRLYILAEIVTLQHFIFLTNAGND